MQIIIEEYQPYWPQKFEEEEQLLSTVLPPGSIIEHIGSTAVPGLAAKPVIDIMIGLADFAMADDLIPHIVGFKYEYLKFIETEMPYRRFFRKFQGQERTHHIHMVGTGSEFWNRHLAFRNYLRTHDEAAAQYTALKRELAQREWDDMNDYADAKTAFIRDIEARAL
jgi:GrpB-like predicted nucleotidyltransferase (UPF0157 family)